MKTESFVTPSQVPSPSISPQTPPTRSRSLWVMWLVVICVLAGVSALVVYRLRTAGTTTAGRGNRAALGDIPVEAAVSRRGSQTRQLA